MKIKNRLKNKFLCIVMKRELKKYSDEDIITLHNELEDRLNEGIFDEVNSKEFCELLKPILDKELDSRENIING